MYVLLCRWVKSLGYNNLVTFESQDATGFPVYHTNVMMAIGSGVAVVCGESVGDSAQRQHLFVRLLSLLCELHRLTESHSPERFTRSSVHTESLLWLPGHA